MKPIVTLAFASLCATALFASCAKETLVEQGNLTPTEEGSRVIAVSFAPQTKTALGDDGLTPEFTGKDEWVKVSNGNKSEDCQVTVDDKGYVSFKTSLPGTLKAVYPAKVAKMDSNNPEQIVGIFIPSFQSGRFADANICMAENISDAATFVNQTAILKFYIGEEIGVTAINVTSSGEEIADDSKTITVAASGGKTLYDDMPTGQDRRICYVAVKSGANANTLTFTTATNTQGQQTKTSTVDATLAIGTMYNAFIPYYVEVGDQKWGYCNIGAFLPEEPGKYFAWGDTAGQIRMNSAWSNGGFHTAPTLVPADPGTLPLEYDAANANWGDDWRMPTMEEFTELCKQCFAEWTVDYNKTGATGMIVWEAKGDDVGWFKPSTSGKGRKIKNDGSGYNGAETHTFSNTYAIGADSHAFFPIAGIGINNAIDYTYYGYYWSSSIYTSSGTAYTFFVYNDDASPQYSNLRFRGLPVRPVYDCSIPDGALPGVFSVGKGADGIEGTADDTKICFSKGNLQAKYSKSSNSYSWQFAADQYQHIVDAPGNTTIASQSDGALVDLFSWSTSSTNYGITNSKTVSFFSGDFLDWGTAYCETNNVTPNTTWRTMSVEEWQYLLSFGDFTNSTRSGLYSTGVKVLGQTNCVILYPDGYEGTKVSNNDNSTYNSKEAWDEAQNAGVVCLPPTSNRNGSTVFGVYNNDRLCYWTSSKINDSELFAWLVQYSNKKFEFEKINGVDGRAVRLVTNVK